MLKLWLFSFLMLIYFLFSSWVYTLGTQGSESAVLADAGSIAGKKIYQDCNCTACHQLFGLGGYVGPELTSVISAPGKGADYARAVLKSGTSRMPDLHLSEEQIENLLSYLVQIDQTAKRKYQG